MSAYTVFVPPAHDDALGKDLGRVNADRARAGLPPITGKDLVEGVVIAWAEAKQMEQRQALERELVSAFSQASQGTQQQVLQLLGLMAV